MTGYETKQQRRREAVAKTLKALWVIRYYAKEK